jgi:hypothetical protein
MALTKVEMWISISAIILIFSLSMLIAGNDLLNSGVKLDSASQEYIQEYRNIVKDNSLDDFGKNETLQEKKKNPLVDFATNLPLISDFLGAVNFFIDKTKTVWNFLAVIYNFPTFFLQGFGLPVGAFSHIINVISTILLVVVTIMAVRLVK